MKYNIFTTSPLAFLTFPLLTVAVFLKMWSQDQQPQHHLGTVCVLTNSSSDSDTCYSLETIVIMYCHTNPLAVSLYVPIKVCTRFWEYPQMYSYLHPDF